MHKIIFLSIFIFFNNNASELLNQMTALAVGCIMIPTANIFYNKFLIAETIAETTLLPFFPGINNTLKGINAPILNPCVSTALYCLDDKLGVEKSQKHLQLKHKIGLNLGLHGIKALLTINGYNLDTVATPILTTTMNNSISLYRAKYILSSLYHALFIPEVTTYLVETYYTIQELSDSSWLNVFNKKK